jgi:hypothetical protein
MVTQISFVPAIGFTDENEGVIFQACRIQAEFEAARLGNVCSCVALILRNAIFLLYKLAV